MGIAGILGIVASFSTDFRWVGGFFVGVVVIYVAQWASYFKRTVNMASELKDNSLAAKFTDASVTFQSKEHVSTVNWSRFSQVWILKDVWLFFIYSKNAYTMLPTASINEELDTFITQKLSENKTKIVRQPEKK